MEGTRPWGPSRKKVPKCIKGSKTTYATIAVAEKQSKRSKKGPFSLYIRSPPVPPRRWNYWGPEGKVPPGPPRFLQPCTKLALSLRATMSHIQKIRSHVIIGQPWVTSDDVMFRQFRPKIRVYGIRLHGCSFKDIINWNNVERIIWRIIDIIDVLTYYMIWRRISSATNCYLRSLKFYYFENFKIFNMFFFSFLKSP